MIRRRYAAAALVLAVATGCADDPPVIDSQTSAAQATPSAADAPPSPSDAPGAIVKSGFGQRDEFAWVTAVVRNDLDEAGATVTVQFNLKDDAGNIIASTDQVESFSRPDQLLAVGTQVDVPSGVTVASVDASLLIEPDGIGEAYPEIPVGDVTVGKDEFGQPSASFEVTNPTAEPLEAPRLGIVCLDAAGKVIGGTSEFPTLVPPNGKVRLDTLSLITTGQPASCEVYAGGP